MLTAANSRPVTTEDSLNSLWDKYLSINSQIEAIEKKLDSSKTTLEIVRSIPDESRQAVSYVSPLKYNKDNHQISIDLKAYGLSSSSLAEYFKHDGSRAMTGNIKLDGNYLSNDGGNEGLSVSDSGDLTATGKLYINTIEPVSPSTVIKIGTEDGFGNYAIHIDSSGQHVGIGVSSAESENFYVNGDQSISGYSKHSALTASKLVCTDADKKLSSIATLSSWIAGTTNRITVTDDGDGTITLSTPQDTHTAAAPTFAGLTLSSAAATTDFKIYNTGTGNPRLVMSLDGITESLVMQLNDAIGDDFEIYKDGVLRFDMETTGSGYSCVQIYQVVDNYGLRIKGYDDRATDFFEFGVNVSGWTAFNSSKLQYYQVAGVNYMYVGYLGVYMFLGTTIADNYPVFFGNDQDYSLGYKSSTDSLYLVDGNSLASNVRMTLNSTGYFGFGSKFSAAQRVEIEDNSATLTALQISNTSTGDRAIIFADNGTEKARIVNIDTDGRLDVAMNNNTVNAMTILQTGFVGIGTTLPTSSFEVYSTGETISAIKAANNNISSQLFGDTDDDDVGAIKYSHVTNSFNFRTAAVSNRITFDSNGRVGINNTAPNGLLHTRMAATNNLFYMDCYSATNVHSDYMYLRRSHNDTLGTITETDDGDVLAGIVFQGVDTGSNFDEGAIIYAKQQGEAGAKVPTDLFLQTSNTTTGRANTIVLKYNGNVGIGTITPATSAALEIAGTTGALLITRLTTTQRDALTAVAGMVIYNATDSKFQGYNGSWVDLH